MAVSKKLKRKQEFAFINLDEEQFYHHKNDMSCCDRNLTNILAKAKKMDAKQVRKINKQMEHKLGPAWFQELSNNQIVAANNLFPALVDDSENCQLNKVNYVLLSIGFHPLPKTSEIMAGIRFSRNNDLAFLWFLFESVYCACEVFGQKKEYSLNERLVLSSICHLDMMTTLRELDRLLPVAAKVEKKPKKEKSKCIKIKHNSPYSEPVIEPKLQPSRHMIIPKTIHPKFEIYQQYLNPFYIIENESNRWYAYEKLANSTSKQIADNIINDQIAKVVNEDFDREKILKSLCEKHRKDANKNEKLMNLLTECRKPSDDNDFLGERLENYSSFEKGVIYGVQLELAKTEGEFKELAEQYQKQVIIKTLLRQILQNATDLKYIHLCNNCEKCMESYKLYQNIVEHNQCHEMNQLPDNIDDKDHFDYNHCHQENQQFFINPTRNSTYSFDYEHIFSTNTLRDVGPVKNAVCKALDLDYNLTEESAITVCLKDIWQYELKLWNEKYEADQDEKDTQIVATEIGRNRQKIFKLLKNAIKMMKKNPKFVLVALPDAHRLPILREWILKRYGIICTQKEIKNKVEANKVQRKTLEKIGVVPRIKVPTYKHFGLKDSIISYHQALLLRPKRDKWIKQYYKDLAMGTIQRNRCYWATMEPYLCDTEGMRRIFYAYAPCCEKKFHPHNAFVMKMDIMVKSEPQNYPHNTASKTTDILSNIKTENPQQIYQKNNTTSQLCAGCGKDIQDRFLLCALDLLWHEDCLKCGCCDCRLGEVASKFYLKGNLLLCKRDYLRLFGSAGDCAACNKVIPAFEMMMRARSNVYHLECFACQQCNHRFCVGDKFYLCDNKIVCQYDYDEMSALASSIDHPPLKQDVKLSRFNGQQENVTSLNTLPSNKRPSQTNDYNNNHNGSYKMMKHAISSN